MHTPGAGMERGEKEKKYTKTNLIKTQTNQKDLEIQIDWRVWVSGIMHLSSRWYTL